MFLSDHTALMCNGALLSIDYSISPEDLFYRTLHILFKPLSPLSKMPYEYSVAPDQPSHQHSLTWELHCPLICRIESIDLSANTVALSSDCADVLADQELHCPHMLCDRCCLQCWKGLINGKCSLSSHCRLVYTSERRWIGLMFVFIVCFTINCW